MILPTLGPRAAPEHAGGAGGRRLFGWDGGSGTTWRSDVGTGLTGILLTQREMTSPQPPAVFRDFWDSAYRAINS
jgi:hypothetical protein